MNGRRNLLFSLVIGMLICFVLAGCVNEQTAAIDKEALMGEQAGSEAGQLDATFFENCAFVSVDFQPGSKHSFTEETLPRAYREANYTVDDINGAIAYLYDVAFPNSRRVAGACRKVGMPMIFLHWGYQFADGMDLDPDTRAAFLKSHGTDYENWPHHISRPDSRPADH